MSESHPADERPETTAEERRESPDIAAAREQLYELFEDESLDLPALQRRAVTLTCRYLDLPEGHVKRIDDPEQGATVTVTNDTADLVPEGAEVDHPGYCKTVIQREESLAVADAVAEGYETNPGYADHGVACYLGAKITVDGEVYGTVCFGAETPRDREFTPVERTFVELLSEALGRRFTEAEMGAELDRTRRKYESLVSSATDAVVLLERDSGEIVEANEGAAELADATDPEALIGSEYLVLFPDDERERYTTHWDWIVDVDGSREWFPDGEPIVVETADGETVPVSVEADRVSLDGREHAQVTIRDIADRRRRERRAEAIFDQTHQFTGLLAPDGTLLEANQTALDFAGVTREQAVGEHFTDAPWWDVDEEYRERLADALDRAADGEFVRYETPVSGVDGEQIIDFSVRPITDETGEVELLIPEGRDVTARVERDRQLAVLSRVLRHNFRNDVGVIGGFAEGIAEGVVDDERSTAARIHRRATQLSKLVARYREAVDLLTDPPAPGAVPAADTVREVVADVTDSAADATVETDLPESCAVEAVPAFRRAVEELLDNAVEHTGPEPTVTVSLDRTESAPEVATGADDEAVTLRIADDGPGLPAAEREVVTGDGTVGVLDHADGVDLWLVYWIVDLSDGRIDVTVDDGTEVAVTLPASDR